MTPLICTAHELTPHTLDDLAQAVREAAECGRSVVPWGTGTRQHIGATPEPDSLIVRTTALNRIVEHIPSDMTVTVEAGIALGTLQAALAQHGQWLPWDPPHAEHATVGGLLATAANGSLRLGYGAPRDWTLGMRVVLGDGRIVKSGGKVVKNVAGYDMYKLHIGALGTLGVIGEVTFKVFPLPEHSRTLAFVHPHRAHILEAIEQLRSPPLAPVSQLWLTGASSLFDPALVAHNDVIAVRFAGVRAAVERQADDALRGMAALDMPLLPWTEAQSDRFRHNAANFAAPRRESLLLRGAVAPAALGAIVDALCRHAPVGEMPPALVAYAGVGVAFAHWPLSRSISVAATVQALANLRAAIAPLGGYVVVEAAPDSARDTLDLWGAPPDSLPLMRALKQQYDPQGILNRGRFLWKREA